MDGETRAYAIAEMIAREVHIQDAANDLNREDMDELQRRMVAAEEKAERLHAALKRGLDVLEENADEETIFWGKDSPFAVDAREIFEQAKAALPNNS